MFFHLFIYRPFFFFHFLLDTWESHCSVSVLWTCSSFAPQHHYVHGLLNITSRWWYDSLKVASEISYINNLSYMALFDPTSLQQNNVSLLQCDIFFPRKKGTWRFQTAFLFFWLFEPSTFNETHEYVFDSGACTMLRESHPQIMQEGWMMVCSLLGRNKRRLFLPRLLARLYLQQISQKRSLFTSVG